MSNEPGPGDSHGCPYRHFSTDNLQSALLTMYSDHGLTSQDMPEIIQLPAGLATPIVKGAEGVGSQMPLQVTPVRSIQ